MEIFWGNDGVGILHQTMEYFIGGLGVADFALSPGGQEHPGVRVLASGSASTTMVVNRVLMQ